MSKSSSSCVVVLSVDKASMCLRRESPRESPRSGMPPASKVPAMPFVLVWVYVEKRSLNI